MRAGALFVNWGKVVGGCMEVLTRHSYAWTQEEDAVCTELWLQGVTARLIGERLGRTQSAVRSRSQHLSLPQRAVGNHLRNSSRILRPPHVRGEETSKDWYDSQQKAFAAVMEAYPSERPSEVPEDELGHVINRGMCIPVSRPSWSSMGDCG
jgi:hypothetical protein